MKDIAYTARHFDAREALQFGLVSSVEHGTGDTTSKEAAVGKAMETARGIATLSPVAVQGTKRVVDFSRDHKIEEGLEYVATW